MRRFGTSASPPLIDAVAEAAEDEPLVDDPWPFFEAGRELSELHLGHETLSRSRCPVWTLRRRLPSDQLSSSTARAL